MKNKKGTDVFGNGTDKRRTKPKWVFRRATIALSETQASMLDELVADRSFNDPMASMTTVMQEALQALYATKPDRKIQ